MRLLLFLLFLTCLSACASIQGIFGDNAVTEKIGLAPSNPKYSENPQMAVPANRQYQRMTRAKMEEESEIHSQAGSMWVGDGQTAYLFVQNKARREGDVLNVKLEGGALHQVETKVGVIKKLLKQLEEQEQGALPAQNLADGTDAAKRAPAAEKKPEKEEKEDLSEIQKVATRIVERLPDGNYRVKGMQPFMIGKREYKVIVTGMIRPEDYNDEGVTSAKLLDPQYDVVSVRKKVSNE